MYNVWVCIHKKHGWILTASCSCMAGLGLVCGHAAALLFKIEKGVHARETNDTSRTIILCQWKLTKKSVETALVSLFDPIPINISDENLKTFCNKKHELYQKLYSIESHKNLLIVRKKQALNPLRMLHRAGRIAASKCFVVYHTDREKTSSLSASNNHAVFWNKINQIWKWQWACSKKMFCWNSKCTPWKLIANETGFKVHTEHPCIGASFDGIVTCF